MRLAFDAGHSWGHEATVENCFDCVRDSAGDWLEQAETDGTLEDFELHDDPNELQQFIDKLELHAEDAESGSIAFSDGPVSRADELQALLFGLHEREAFAKAFELSQTKGNDT